MEKQANMAQHAATAATDIASVALIKLIVGLHQYKKGIAARLHEYDSWPNTDGHIEILDEDRQPMGVIWAQVKGLPENHGLKFACPTGLFEFAVQVEPILLLGVDLQGRDPKEIDLKELRVYWNYYDEDIVAGLKYAGKQTLTVEFDQSRSFTIQEMDCVDAWRQLVADRKARIPGLRDTIKNQLFNMIDVSKQLLDNYRYTETLRYLTDLKAKQWDIADNSARFRILTTMAAALYQCNKPEEAAQYFLEAYKFDPSAPKALSNRALAYLLKNEFEKAQDEASEILKINPLNLNASAIKVLAMGESGQTYETIKMSIDSEALKTAEVSYALGFVAQKAKLAGEARSLFERAASQDNDPHMAATFGINLLEEITIDNPRATRSTLTVAQRDQARHAVDLLQKAWASIPDEEDRKIRPEWLFNRMVAYRMLGEDSNAEKAADELLRLKPNEDLHIKYAAFIAFESGKLSTAESYLTRQIGNGSQMPDLKLMLIDVLTAQGKLDEAEESTLRFIDLCGKQDHLWIIAHQTLFDIYLRQERLDKAGQLAAQLTAQDATKVLGRLFSARLAIMKQDSELAVSLLEQAEADMPEDIDKTAVLTLAEEAYTAKVYEIAAKAYEKVLQSDVDDQFTGRFLHSLFEAKRFQMAITVAESIRKKYGASRRVTQFEWSSYLELQDLPNARKVFVEYLKTHPEDEDAKLSITLIDIRSDNSGELNKFLDEPKDLGKLSLHSRIQLAELYELSGRTTQALELSYDTRKKFENDPDAHMAYFSLMVRLDTSVPELLEPATVQPNSVLLYNGGFFVIEADRDPQIRDNEISVEEARRRGFIDKKVGDKVELTRNHLIGAKEVSITAIKSKYIHALQDTMLNYERRFPQRSDLASFSVEDADFTPLLIHLDRRHDHVTHIENLYKDGRITIDAFAHLVNRDFMDIFYALRSMPDLGVKATGGNIEEEQKSLELLQRNSNRKIVADITSLITFYELGLQPGEIGLEKFIVAQTTYDLAFQQIIKERAFGNKKQGTLYKQNGQYRQQEMTLEQHNKRIEYFERFLNWMKSNTTTASLQQEQLDALKQAVPNPDKLKDFIAPHQLDTILLAHGDESVLYCDDFFLRHLASETFGVDGVWTQTLLMNQLKQGSLGKQMYEEVTVKLANSYYHYIVIDPETLLEAAKQANWLPNDPFTRVLKTLTRPETTIESMVIVLTNFLYEFYKRPMTPNRGGIIQQILTEAIRHHNRMQFLTFLIQGIQARFKLLPLQAKEIEANIEAWRLLHNI